MKRILLAAALCAAGTAANAGVEIDYENFYIDDTLGRAKVIIKITNATPTKVSMAFVECAFMDKNERAMDTAVLIGSNIEAGQDAYVDGWSAQMADIDKVSCRLSRYR